MKYFNLSHLQHIAAAVIMQTVIGLLTGNLLAGTTFAIGAYIFREHAQREYWIMIEENIGRDKIGFFKGFTGWSADAVGDAIWPALAVLAIYFARITYSLPIFGL